MRYFLRLLLFLVLFCVFSFSLSAQSANLAQTDESLLEEVTRFGRGSVQHVEWHPERDLILVDTIRGAWLYTVDTGYRLRDEAHIEEARLARFSPDGHLLAGVNAENEITLWNADTYTQQASLSGHDAYVKRLAWQPYGTQLASLDHTGSIFIWDTVVYEQVLHLQFDGADHISWSPHGNYLAACDPQSGITRVWNTSGELILTATAEQAPGCNLTWRNDTQFLLYTVNEVPVGDVWDVSTGNVMPRPKISYSNQYSPDGTLLAAGNLNGAAIYDTDSGTLQASIDGAYTTVVAWSNDSKYVAFGDWKSNVHDETHVIIAEGATGEIIGDFSFEETIEKLYWRPNHDELIIVDSASQMFIVNFDSWSSPNPSILHTDIGTSAAWRSDGQVIAAADTNYGARIWDAQTGEQLVTRMHQGQPATMLAWQPGGTLLATAGGDSRQSQNNNVTIWDTSVEYSNSVNHLMTIPHINLVADIAWSPDGKTLASAERNQYLRLWQPEQPNTIKVIDTWAIRLAPYIDYTQIIYSLGWSPEGDLLDFSYLGTGNGGVMQVVDIEQMALIEQSTPQMRYSTWTWTPDNRFIWATWSTNPVMQNYDVTLGGAGVADPAPVFSGLSNSVRHASFSPDTRLLIGIDAHNNAIIWDTETGAKLANLPDATHEPVWSPNSRMVALYGTDDYIHILEAQTGKSLHIFTQHLAEANEGYLDRPQVIWSPDAHKLAILDQGALFIYEIQ